MTQLAEPVSVVTDFGRHERRAMDSLLCSLPRRDLAGLLWRVLEQRRAESFHGASRDSLVRELRLCQDLEHAVRVHLNEVAAKVYDGRHPKHWLWRNHKQFILDHVRPSEHILDIGCGASAYLLWMCELGARVTAIDINPQRIELARSIMSHPNLRFEVCDAMQRVPEGTYDCVICSHVIEHLDDPLPMLRRLREIAPRLIVAVPPADASWQKIMYRDLGLDWMDDPDHRREYTPGMLEDELTRAGWTIDELKAGVDIKAIARPAA